MKLWLDIGNSLAVLCQTAILLPGVALSQIYRLLHGTRSSATTWLSFLCRRKYRRGGRGKGLSKCAGAWVSEQTLEKKRPSQIAAMIVTKANLASWSQLPRHMRTILDQPRLPVQRNVFHDQMICGSCVSQVRQAQAVDRSTTSGSVT